MKSLKTGKSAIRAIFWKRFRYDKKDYFVEIVNDSGVGEDFTLYKLRRQQKCRKDCDRNRDLPKAIEW